MKFIKPLFLLVASASIFTACQKQDLSAPPDAGNTSGQKNSHLASDIANDWMEVYRRVVKSEGKNPPQASRVYAYAAIGLYQAVVPGLSNYNSLEGQVPGLDNLPTLTNRGQIDFQLCANEALYKIAKSIFVTLKPANAVLIDSLHTAYNNEFDGKDEVFLNSTAFGRNVATAVLDRADNDEFGTTRNLPYVVPSPSVNASFWVPTSAVVIPLEPNWGKLKCFVMPNGAACSIKSKIPFNTNTNSDFYKQAEEVLNTVNNLTQTQKDIALWWADGSGATPTPSGHWVGIGMQVANQLNLDLPKTAEMYAMLNISMADAFISCWNEKFQCNLLRPISFIRNNIPGQSNWSSFIGTPPFPEYPSGHSVASGAAADILTNLFGDINFTDDANVSLGLSPRTYHSFAEAANEAAISRLYGGIHFREAIENGLVQGKEVSLAFSKKIKLRK